MSRLLLSAMAIALLGLPVVAQDRIEIDPKWAAPVFAADAPERKLRQTALQKKREEANRKDREAWAKITTKEAWEKYRDAKLALLRDSLGPFPEPAKNVPVMVTRKIEGDGFIVENI